MRMVKKACHETPSGGSRGGVRGTRPLPPYFLEQAEAQRTEKVLFGDPPPPPYLRVWMTAPSLSQGLDPALWKIVHIYIYNFVRASRFFVHFFAVTALLITTWKCLFTFRRGRERRTTTFSFFSWTLIQSFRIEPQKKLPTFDELKEMV